MLRFAWATALATLLVLALNLTLLDPANHTASCAQLELEFESEDFKGSIPEAPALIIGNQRVRYWETPPSSLSARASISRSAPGLNPALINRCFPRLVGFYQPSLVVIPVDTAHAVNIDQSELITALKGIIDQRTEYSLDFDLWVMYALKSETFCIRVCSRMEKIDVKPSDFIETLASSNKPSLMTGAQAL